MPARTPSPPSAPADSAPAADTAEAPLSEGAARRAARMATPRLLREARTIDVMSAMYCRDHHGDLPRNPQGLCADCESLRDYARKRLAGCPYGPDKPTCANCQIHCYGPKQREATREVMRYAGPRMLMRHPVLAIAHLVDGQRPAPPKPRGKTATGATAAQPAPDSAQGTAKGR
jgi:hypothetical protein